MADRARPRILVFGAGGQVGWELTRALAPLGEMRALDSGSVDLHDLDAVRTTVRDAAADVVVNAAAYTQVDRAEADRESAHRINAEAPGVMADEVARHDGILIHYSTDYVFDGLSRTPYLESNLPAPISVYGETKADGDRRVLASGARAYIFRLSWVYGLRGQNFLRTIQRLAQEQGELRVVADQWGTPTWCRTVAESTALALGQILRQRMDGGTVAEPGIYHLAAPDSATWHEFAAAIVALTELPETKPRPAVHAIATGDYPTAARRPARAVLDSGKVHRAFGIQLPGWHEQLALCLDL